MWMDWQLTVLQPGMHAAFWGMIRTPPEQRDPAAIEASKQKSTQSMKILDAQLAKTAFIAGDAFSYGDIPVALNTYRYWHLVPEHPPLPNLKRWYDAVSSRQAFKDHVSAVPIT
jgi:glutathione S-transferase